MTGYIHDEFPEPRFKNFDSDDIVVVDIPLSDEVVPFLDKELIIDKYPELKNKVIYYDSYQYLEPCQHENFSDYHFNIEANLYNDVARENLDRADEIIGGKTKNVSVTLNNMINREHRLVLSHALAEMCDKNQISHTQSFYPGVKNLAMLQDIIDTEKESRYYSTFKYQTKGFASLLDYRWVGDDFAGKNCDAYRRFLGKEVFEPARVGIVAESIGYERGCQITEKYINAVVSLSIPIVYGFNVRESLATMGFDTFDDIVDYDYEFRPNCMERALSLVYRNQALLTYDNYNLYNSHSIKRRLKKNLEVLIDYDFNFIRTWYNRPEEVINILKVADTVLYKPPRY